MSDDEPAAIHHQPMLRIPIQSPPTETPPEQSSVTPAPESQNAVPVAPIGDNSRKTIHQAEAMGARAPIPNPWPPEGFIVGGAQSLEDRVRGALQTAKPGVQAIAKELRSAA